MSLIKIVVGDLYGDGHGHSEDFVVETNTAIEEIKKAYKKGVKIIGVNLINDVAVEYQDGSIDEELFAKFQQLGFKDIDTSFLSADDFFDLYIFTVKTGNPSIELNKIDIDSIEIGGYGLF